MRSEVGLGRIRRQTDRQPPNRQQQCQERRCKEHQPHRRRRQERLAAGRRFCGRSAPRGAEGGHRAEGRHRGHQARRVSPDRLEGMPALAHRRDFDQRRELPILVVTRISAGTSTSDSPAARPESGTTHRSSQLFMDRTARTGSSTPTSNSAVHATPAVGTAFIPVTRRAPPRTAGSRSCSRDGRLGEVCAPASQPTA
jgi:hypothetical protein